MCQQSDQHALRDVVSLPSSLAVPILFQIHLLTLLTRHASIDPAIRAARGLPEDLIRLCVGIEDPADLLDDLRHALIEAGAITFAANNYIRIPNPISRAVEKLALGEARTARPQDHREWFVSAPGKVILFGEHAVVHGVVSDLRAVVHGHIVDSLIDCCRCIRGSSLLRSHFSTT